MMRSSLIVLFVLLIFNLSGCASFSRPVPKVESIQAGQSVPEKVRQYCSGIVTKCRTDTENALLLENAKGGSLAVDKQVEFDNRFVACVRDQEKDCHITSVEPLSLEGVESKKNNLQKKEKVNNF